jgi:IS30 family transposase
LNRIRGDGPYCATSAAHQAYFKKKYSRFEWKKIRAMPELERYVITELKRGMPPETISGRMRQQKKPWYISKTAIYAWLYSVWGERYCRYLFSQRSKPKKRGAKKVKKSLIPHRISIHARPKMTERDYEGDTMVCAQSTASFATIYNPLTMYVDARTIPNLKPAVAERTFKRMIRPLKITSATFDNGQENREHLKLGIRTYFCDPYSSWQKPGVENANKLIRRYAPKGSDLSQYFARWLKRVVEKLNNTPRKKLGWKTPCEVMQEKRLFKNKKAPPRG